MWTLKCSLREVSCKLLSSVNDQRLKLKRQHWESRRIEKAGAAFFEISLWPPLEPGSWVGQWVRTRVTLWPTLAVPLSHCVPLLWTPHPAPQNHIPNNQTPGWLPTQNLTLQTSYCFNLVNLRTSWKGDVLNYFICGPLVGQQGKFWEPGYQSVHCTVREALCKDNACSNGILPNSVWKQRFWLWEWIFWQ